ncbi:MAG TPA: hypothetical protein VJS64_05070 [Pyrinomonadaceae bacterium]|nr:hypothetical protein [Pyrinomonadaceae bacterium]
MSRQVNLISNSEQVDRSTGNLSSVGQTSSRQSGALSRYETGCASRPTSPDQSAQATPEIALDQTRVNDQVVIRTAHSTYIFLVTDPSRHLGLVVGGLFGDYAAEVFLEVLPVTEHHRLKAGMRVCFYIGSRAGCKRVITSAVTELIYRRTGTESPR